MPDTKCFMRIISVDPGERNKFRRHSFVLVSSARKMKELCRDRV